MNKSKITSHILDTEIGKPAKDVAIKLEHLNQGIWELIGDGVTGSDGRVVDWIKSEIQTGHFRISFDVESYFSKQNRESFYPNVSIEFYLKNLTEHYHVPLLLNAHGYSTYRGS